MDGKPAPAPAILVALLLLCVAGIGSAGGEGCSLSSITVTQAGTGEWAHGQPVYAVTVRNTCGCAQSGLELACAGFDSTLAVDPAKLEPVGSGGACLVNGGAPVAQGSDVTFSYAWSTQFALQPVSSTLRC